MAIYWLGYDNDDDDKRELLSRCGVLDCLFFISISISWIRSNVFSSCIKWKTERNITTKKSISDICSAVQLIEFDFSFCRNFNFAGKSYYVYNMRDDHDVKSLSDQWLKSYKFER